MYKEQIEENKTLQNIETNSMVNVESAKETKYNVTVRFNTSGKFKFTALARKAFTKGALLSHDKIAMGADLLAFHLKVSSLNDEEIMEFSHKDISLLKEALMNRIQHCEEERDSNSDLIKQCFNSDTYISMKYLLLDLQLWLLGETIEDIRGTKAPFKHETINED